MKFNFKNKIIIIISVVLLVIICSVIVHFWLKAMDYDNFDYKNYYYESIEADEETETTPEKYYFHFSQN